VGLPDVLVPSATALLVIDMQEAFFGPGALVPVHDRKGLCDRLRTTLTEFRNLGVRVIWTRVFMDETRAGVYPLLWPSHYDREGAPLLRKHGPLFPITADMRASVRPEDLMVDKPSFSAFFKTNLHSHLCRAGVRWLLHAGVVTNVCVESTLRDAFHLGYYPVLLSDCTRSINVELQRLCESVIAMVFGFVAPADEVASRLGRSPSPPTTTS